MKVESVGKAEGAARVSGSAKRKRREAGTDAKADAAANGRAGKNIGQGRNSGVDITG